MEENVRLIPSLAISPRSHYTHESKVVVSLQGSNASQKMTPAEMVALDTQYPKLLASKVQSLMPGGAMEDAGSINQTSLQPNMAADVLRLQSKLVRPRSLHDMSADTLLHRPDLRRERARLRQRVDGPSQPYQTLEPAMELRASQGGFRRAMFSYLQWARDQAWVFGRQEDMGTLL